jgi:hypothetical protein
VERMTCGTYVDGHEADTTVTYTALTLNDYRRVLLFVYVSY